MSDNVLPLRTKPPDSIWRCACGCISFKAHSDQTLECSICGDRRSTGAGMWVREPPPVTLAPIEEVKRVQTLQKTPAMTLRDLAQEKADWVFILAVRKNGRHTLSADEIKTEEQLDWLERQFDLVRAMLVKGKRTAEG
jgi:hypothetical protein